MMIYIIAEGTWYCHIAPLPHDIRNYKQKFTEISNKMHTNGNSMIRRENDKNAIEMTISRK